MGVRYYLSGCAHTKTFHNTLGNLLSHDINKTDNIVFIAGEPTDKDYAFSSAEWFLRELSDIGIHFQNFKVIHYYSPRHLVKHWVSNADMIVLLGGNPVRQKRMCKQLHIWKLLKEYGGIMLGMSAGAMNMSQYIIIPPHAYVYPDGIIRDGLNKDNISIVPHNNFMDNEYPEEYKAPDGLYWKEDLISIANDLGPFYLLQDVDITIDETEINCNTFIRADNTEHKIYRENKGRVWEVQGNQITLININK